MEPLLVPASLSALLPGPPEVYPSAKGKVYLWEPAPGILVSRVVGTLSADGALAMEAASRRSIGKYGVHSVFHDWEEMTDYEAEARTHLTRFGLEARKNLDNVHMLVRARVVQFGVQAANLVVRRIQVHETRAPFEAALRRAISDKLR